MAAPEAERGSIQVISRAAAILRCLENEPEGLSLGAIAKRIDLPRSTVQRLVDALALEHLLEVQGAAGVKLGPALMRLAAHSHLDISQQARPHMEALSMRTGETVVLLHATGAQLLILHAVVSTQPLRVAPDSSTYLNIHATAGGKVLLARMSDEAVSDLLGADLKAMTRQTRTRLPELLSELAQIRRDGFAYDNAEHMPGVSAVGVDVFVAPQTYALCVVGPSARIKEGKDSIREMLMETRKALLAALL